MNCIVEECDRDIEIKKDQMCRKHYKRNLYHGTPYLEVKVLPKECSIEWCDRDRTSKGYCALHYQRSLDGRDMDMQPRVFRRECEVEECNGIHYAKGLCSIHYERKRSGRDMNGVRAKRRKAPVTNCLALDCERDAQAAGYCMAHYQQQWKGKDLTPIQQYSTNRPVVDGYKECSECLETLPVSDYYSRGDRPHIFSKCKTCTMALQEFRKWETGKGPYPLNYEAHLVSIGRLN